MKLLPRLSIILGLVLLLMAGANHLALRSAVLPKFEEVELQFAERNTQRVQEAVENELRHLSSSARDWAFRDDSYHFARGENPGYVDAYMTGESLNSLGIDALRFYAADGHVLWSSQALRAAGTGAPEKIFESFDGGAFSRFAAGDADAQEGRTGLVATPNGPALVVALPILTTDGKGAATGALIMAKLLDATTVAGLAEQTQVPFRLLPAPEDFLPSAGFAERASVDPTLSFAIAGGDLLVHTFLVDVTGKPAALVELTLPRHIFAIGVDSVNAASLNLLVVGAVVLLIVGVLLRLIAIKPIMQLTRHVLDVAESGDLRKRSPIERPDEIGILARQFNATLGQLADTREQLLEQSYYSGMAEIVAGVLHNIRNAINPILVHFWTLRTIVNGQNRNLIRAVEEIADAGTPPERRAKLIEFARLASEQQATERERTVATCDLAAAQLKQVEEILQQNERHSGYAQQREEIDLRRVIDDAGRQLLGRPSGQGQVQLVTTQLAAAMLPAVLGNRIVLTQVIGNILVNAAESIAAAGRSDGRITVAARLAEDGAESFVHLLVADNGEGFDEPRKSKLFRRGYSTREHKRGGLGLHWCSNSVSAMGGRITLDSKGPGAGATAHLYLPAAASRIEEVAA